MKTIILIFILLLPGMETYSQNPEKMVDSRPLNSVYLNFFGDASFISLNYERQFLVSKTFIISSKVGLGYNEEFQFLCFPLCLSNEKYLTVPHHITANLGKERHFFEFGFGGTNVIGNESQPYFFYPIVGYRFLPVRSGKFNFRAFVKIPFSELESDNIIFIPLGLSFGISF